MPPASWGLGFNNFRRFRVHVFVAWMGFFGLSKHVLVSHGYMHLVEVGGAVEVGGMLVRPGDLIVADQHGAIQVPSSIARDIPAAAAQIELKERKTIAFYTDPAYSPGDQLEGKYP